MNFLPNTDKDREEMLKTIGVKSIDELFSDIPPALRLNRELNLPPAMSEYELLRHMRELSEKNVAKDYVTFIGAGSYDHYVPSVVRHVISRSEFYTAYTPYQPEVSQAVLQSIYEYQTMICELTGMDAANASMYDGASAAAESVTIAAGLTRRKKALVSRTVHPETRAVIKTYAAGHNIEVREVQLENGVTSLKALGDMLDKDVACVVIQEPNFFGCIEPVDEISKEVQAAGATLIVSVNPITLGLLRPPSEYGAEIVVGEGQVLGNPMAFGGPYLGVLAVKDKYLRRMPGRLVGMTTDTRGQRGFVLTLQTREQHIRRERATSNICSNEALNALAATVYLTWLGKAGIREIGEMCVKKAAYLADGISHIKGFSLAWKTPFFNEFAVKCPVAPEKIVEALLEKKILAGYPLGKAYPEFKDYLLIAVTEKRTRKEMDDLLAGLEGLA
ncbi:MAG: aminomethyl-transferring glycine dehydrogenase subunit GcvPA [Candidatus Fermentithermobacillus carboniphilus]|uniref:Probable glycine dehydrogenase (decarboxylating) subunit 1 n=1 Tax=Candidatus Fermentithermobacillus carboniphilus TaxID=3085328 RepID=A0AAT9LFE9_9FIRM|nr:MAG: aminomethyl-transferring glycine dehydrogenase subunit GcvPA [Candidatus Fermentithermobacillus carboniphilus]